MFKKAVPVPSRLKIAMYGPAGSGKTFTALMVAEGISKATGKRIALVDTEAGSRPYAKKRPSKVHPEAFDFDVLETKSITQTLAAVKGLDPKTHQCVILDSISYLWDACMASYEAKTSANTIPMHAWGEVKRPMKELIAWCLDSPFDVFILGRQKNLFEDDGSGGIRKVGVAMKAEGETPYEPDVLLQMQSVRSKADPREALYRASCEKDRWGVFAGRTVDNPTYKDFEPLMALLGEGGEGHTPHASEEDALDADVEARIERDAKKKDKERESKELVIDFKTEMARATTLDELNEAGKRVKKHSRKITAADRDSLTAFFVEQRGRLAAQEAKEFA